MNWTKSQLVALVRQTARKYGIDENIAVAQIQKESNFSLTACSNKGACGIAQFIPGTAARFGVNRRDPVSSMEGWGKYMTFLLRRYNGDYAKALAGYNAGEGNVDKYGGVPPFAETRDYVKTILENAGKGISSFSGGLLPFGFGDSKPKITDQQAKIAKQPIPQEWKGLIVMVLALIVFFFIFSEIDVF